MEVPSVCPNKSVCVNKLGSYECNCISGYETNGMGMCTGMITIYISGHVHVWFKNYEEYEFTLLRR